jgi:hypothetical protein
MTPEPVQYHSNYSCREKSKKTKQTKKQAREPDYLSRITQSQSRWLTPIIPATWKAEIRRIKTQAPAWAKR